MNANILIVEDEAEIQNILKELLTDAGYSTDVASDGLEGITAFRQKSYDLVLLDLMLVSKLTSGDFKPLRRTADLSVLVQECLGLYEPLASKKHIVLDSNNLESVPLEVDKKLFEKALSNLVNNAILYSPAGERITVALTSKSLTIENTGVQIPEGKLPDLFAPLTRVEESRSKNTGGSGLGLYIVKTILDFHGLPCGIQNIENGVRFTIYLHQNQNDIKSNLRVNRPNVY